MHPAIPKGASQPIAAFYFDLGSPLAYLAAERVLHVLPQPAEWQPVLARELVRYTDGVVADSAREGFAQAPHADRAAAQAEPTDRVALTQRAQELGLQPLRWPDPFPFDSELAMRVATYAKSIGRTVPFAQAAFRQAFAGGRSLAEQDFVLIAAAACEMHPTAVLQGAALRSVAEQLATATATAAARGVTNVPAVAVDGHVFHGGTAPEQAAEHMREMDARALTA